MTTDVRGFIRSIQCRGDHCDQKSVEYIAHPDIRNTGQCYWSRYFSEESPNRYQCSTSEFIAGIRCQGNYCDNLSLYCCRGEFNAASTTASVVAEPKSPNLTPLLGQTPVQQQPKTIISVVKPLADIAGSRFAVNYVDNVQGNRFNAVMEFAPDLTGARWRYSNQQGSWHPLRITSTSGNNMRLQGEYTESGTRVQETYNVDFSTDHRQVNGSASFVFSMANGSVLQRNYEVKGARQ
ncbi:MAG: hypothetical protein OQL20_01075 [Sedimenticola sp.]|nr:hypothetical protein [Sedimenticola sp.]